MAHTDSIYDLFNKLCVHYSADAKSSHKTYYRSNTCGSQNDFSKKLKEKLYGILLKFNNQSFSSKTSHFVGSTEIDTLLAHVYMLRLSRKFDDGNHLENLLNRLRKIAGHGSEEIQSCLRFLICLAGTGTVMKPSFSQDKIPKIMVGKDDCCIFPMGPLQYGDSSYFRSSHHFMHYPREVFEQVLPYLSDENSVLLREKASYQNSLFEMPPGYDVNGNLLFKVSETRSDDYDARNCTEPLFGALFQKVRMDEKNLLSIRLQIPELSETFSLRPMDFKLLSAPISSTKKGSAESNSEDEGFIESPLSFTSSGSINEDIWEAALKTKPKTWFSWETIGCYTMKKEKPFLTEAGSQVVDMLHQAHLHELYLLNPSFVGIAPITISQECLIRAVLNLLIGVPSDIFYFSEDTHEFTVRSGIHIQGLTPDSMKLLLSDFVQAGTDYHRMVTFCDESVLLHAHSTRGLVLQAFKGGLNQYLHYYQAAVLSFCEQQFTVLQLGKAFHCLMQQLRFLAHLCKLTSSDETETGQSLPMGVDLLSYLFQHTLEQSGHDHYLVMIFLLRSASLPYLKFLQEWIFEGICNDPFGEFHVKSNDIYLNARDNTYWIKGYLLSSSDVHKCVPPFLHHIASDIFICGKSLNLLKICCPKHHLYHGDHKHPPLMFTFSRKKVDYISKISKHYAETMKKIAIQEQLKVQQQQEQKESEKIALLHQAQQKRAESLAENQKKIKAAKLKQNQKKRNYLQELEAQIEETKIFRQQMKEQQLARENELLNPAEMELIEDIKKDIEEEYLEKTRKTELHILRAQWRTQRYHLHKTRVEFLHNEQNSLQTDMENLSLVQGTIKKDKLVYTTDSTITSYSNLEEISWTKRTCLTEGHGSELTNENKDQLSVEQNSIKAEVDEVSTEDYLENKSGQDSNGSGKEHLCLHVKNASVQHEHNTKMEESEGKLEAKNTSESNDQNEHFIKKETVLLQFKPDLNTETPINYSNNEKNTLVVKASDNSKVSTASLSFSDANYALADETNTAGSSVKQSVCIRSQSTENLISEVNLDRIKLSCLESANSVHTKLNEISFSEIPQHEDKKSEKRTCTFREQCYPEQSNNDSKARSERGTETWKSALRDHASNTILKFRGRSIHGHSSDSTIQNLIYGQRILPKEKAYKHKQQNVKETESTENLKDIILKDISVLSSSCAHPYQKDFSILGELPLPDLVSNLASSEMKSTENSDDDISCCQHNFLPALLHRCLLPPLLAQIQIVNKSVVDYFLITLNINSHFAVLRNFFFFQDGEFGQSLSHLLFEKISCCHKPSELLNPLTLSSILTQALAFSIYGDHPLADNLSFAIKSIPADFPHNVSGILNHLELRYKVEWPCNIVITEQNIDYYNKIFGLLLQVKRALWSLTDIWFHLKRTARFHGLDNSPQYRQLQLYRHEMQHFARVVQSYIASQILQVTWQEFQTALQQKVHTLDDLCEAHSSYLKRACFRCLLFKKAAPVMKIIQDIFNLILKFHSKLIISSWEKNPESGLLEHPAFQSLLSSYKIFKRYSGFLYKAWLYKAVGAPSHEEISGKTVSTTLARLFRDV